MIKHLLHIVVVLIVGSNAIAQDIHFSQFYNTPLYTNPAATGHFDATYRFNGIIRRQYASVSAQPYQTFGVGVDMNAPFNLKGTGIGLSVYQDNTGLSAFSTFSSNASLAGRLKFLSDKSLTIGLGGSFGYTSQSVDYSKLKFDTQYNGKIFNPDFITGEKIGSINYAWTSASFGGFIQKEWSKRTNILVGYSTYNYAQQDQGSNPFFGVETRNSIQALTSFELTKRFDLLPAAQFMFQGQAKEYLLGTSLRYYTQNSRMNQQALLLGVWTRWQDAAIVSLGYERNQLTIGASYDINYSAFNVATNYRGGWEVALIYTISTVRENIKRLRTCPDYF